MKEKESTQLMTINKETPFVVKIKYFASFCMLICGHFTYWKKNLTVFLSLERQMASLDACRTLAAVFLRLV